MAELPPEAVQNLPWAECWALQPLIPTVFFILGLARPGGIGYPAGDVTGIISKGGYSYETLYVSRNRRRVSRLDAARWL